ncbi:isoamylase early set domain-containing protein [Niabella yanshanensis]|uniref:Isoamylase early set domain-containing protein n=1 Tax=Niabella yanshanensis TaxID=577386 RepID=A0ABZ0VZF5_9BACT|nr:isoamylase early set domain-containing protein [Niabella yanshanensis]WQD36413.1 isoamylase early set domain-containing protein [Niabella yanshanensis]
MKKITFTLPAEALGNATGAVLLGDFNDWNFDKGISLSVQPDGTLAASVELEAGKSYQYRFLLSDGTWVNDWAAQQYVHDAAFGVENSLIIVPAETIVEKVATIAKKVKAAVTPKEATAKPKKEAKAAAPKVKKEKEATVTKKVKAEAAAPKEESAKPQKEAKTVAPATKRKKLK